MSMEDDIVQDKSFSTEELLEIWEMARKEMYKAGQEIMIQNEIYQHCIWGIRKFLEIIDSEPFKKHGRAILQFPPLAEQDLREDIVFRPEEIDMMEVQILGNFKQILSIMGLQDSIMIEVAPTD